MAFAGLIVAPALVGAVPQHTVEGASDKINLSIRDTPIEEVYEMLSRQQRVNVLLGRGIKGDISVNLYGVSVDEAIRLIADAAGYVVENRSGAYIILERGDAGMDSTSGNTQIRSLKVQYSDPGVVADVLTKHLSRYGKITTLEERKLLVVEDLPDFMERIEVLLAEIDKEPRQVLIEAKILEITLLADETFGIDWKIIQNNTQFGTRGLANPVSPGFFLDVMKSNLELFLNALANKGRVRTLSTPKLLLLENGEAEVVVGDRIGYSVTTTINLVTSESIEFLETGVILNVKASVDRAGRVLMDIHPEVSSGTVSDDGIPSKRTTEVTTQLLAENGQKVFIGGLITSTSNQNRTGVPIVSGIPLLGHLFARDQDQVRKTETVVVITPYIIDLDRSKESEVYGAQANAIEDAVDRETEDMVGAYLKSKDRTPTTVTKKPRPAAPFPLDNYED